MIIPLFKLLSWAALRVFYRRVEAESVERVPAEGAVLFVPNHTNGLVDPLVVQHHLKRWITPTGKAALGKNPLLRFLIWGLDAVTFDRVEDNDDARRSAAANKHAIDRCREALRAGQALCLFPEGKSHSDPTMRPFKQGVARIALGLPTPLMIVPVGITYQRKDRFRSDVRVCYGEPIAVNNLPQDRPGFTQALREHIEALTTGPGGIDRGGLAEHAAAVLEAERAAPRRAGHPPDLAMTPVRRLQAGRQAMGAEHAPRVREVERQVAWHKRRLEEVGATPADLTVPMTPWRAVYFLIREAEMIVAGGVLALIGLINHALPAAITRAVASRMTRDDDQYASNAIYPGMLVFPLCYALQLLAAWLVLPAWAAALYTAALPLSGLYLLHWRDHVARAVQRARAYLHWRAAPATHKSLREQSRTICAAIRELNEGSGDALPTS